MKHSKIKKKIILLLVISCWFLGNYFLIAPITLASEYDRAYQDYVYNYNQYRRTHQNYLTAKNKYSTYKTLSAKTEALNTAAEMLKQRDETLRTYLIAVRQKLGETAHHTLSLSYFANMLYLNLEREINWLADHQTKFSSAATFQDLLAFSAETESKQTYLELLAYQGLSLTAADRLRESSTQMAKIINQLAEKIASIREEAKMDIVIPERWLLEAENKYQLSQEKQNEAASAIQQLQPQKDGQGNFQKIITFLEESNQYLKETISNLLETIAYLRGEK